MTPQQKYRQSEKGKQKARERNVKAEYKWQRKYSKTEKGREKQALANKARRSAMSEEEKKKYWGYDEKRYWISTNWRMKNRLQTLLIAARSRAKKLNLPFDLTIEDIPIPDVCPILGIPITYEGSKDNLPSLDRLVPSKGYVRGNVFVVSHKGNTLKNCHTLETLELLRQYITTRLTHS